METIVLEECPVLSSLYFRALFMRKSGLRKGQPLPLVEMACNGFRVDPTRLQAYCEVTGSKIGTSLPLLYPYVLTAPVQMSILCSKLFPLRPMGIVHVRNDVNQRRAIRPDETMDARCMVGKTRVAKKGLEFDINTRVTVKGDPVWECASTYLCRGRFGEEEAAPESARLPELTNPEAETRWKVGKDMGRRYARVSGDYNPIHVSSILAKLFRSPSVIIHGMWSAARCLAALGESGAPLDGPARYLVLFKGPVPLGSEVAMKSKAVDGAWRFEAYCADNPKPCVCGLLERAAS